MLSSVMSRFAAGTPGIHISLKAEPVFEVGGVTVTNAMIYGVVSASIICWLLYSFARKSTVKAQKGPLAVFEIIMEFIISMLEGAFGSRKRAVEYAPIYATFFLFIMCTNILGLVPVVGPGISVGETPVFRPLTADLNGTIALSAIAIIAVQVLSIKKQGLGGHLKHYFTDKPFNPINTFIGILELFGELTRILSLSVRLFINTAVGEMLIAIFTGIVFINGQTPLAALPIFMFEFLVAGIQAYVFTILTALYLAQAISHAHDDDEHHDDAKPLEVEKLAPSPS